MNDLLFLAFFPLFVRDFGATNSLHSEKLSTVGAGNLLQSTKLSSVVVFLGDLGAATGCGSTWSACELCIEYYIIIKFDVILTCIFYLNLFHTCPSNGGAVSTVSNLSDFLGVGTGFCGD